MVAALLVGVMPAAPIAFAQQAPAAPKICAAPGVNPRLVAHVPANVKSARMYFSAAPSGPEYYVDMHPGIGDWWAILPPVDTSTKAVTYRVAVPDANQGWVKGPSVTVATTSACPPAQMTAAELEAANNIVLGLTNVSESPVPVGFTCRGIKSVVDANGQMRPADECRNLLATAAVPGAAHSATAVHAGTIAAVAVGAAALGYAVGHSNQNNNPVSNSRP